ncbi:MAG: hypothetical protein RLZZ15_2657 [Verrucomicrobiota bacterium]|jgi:predicted dithiol-disulfide oxidoreductase (DUF899 family)
MKLTAAQKKIRALEHSILRDQGKLAALKRKQPRELVPDYVLSTSQGPVRLSALFGAKRDLIVVHNMGRECPYCTLWADGFNGLYPHLADRAAFVVVSPDPPAAQEEFAATRAWRFPIASGHGGTFIQAMGFLPRPGEPLPGVSTFVKERGKIFRVASAPFGPGDAFCSAWNFFALLAGGVDDWAPRYRY